MSTRYDGVLIHGGTPMVCFETGPKAVMALEKAIDQVKLIYSSDATGNLFTVSVGSTGFPQSRAK